MRTRPLRFIFPSRVNIKTQSYYKYTMIHNTYIIFNFLDLCLEISMRNE